MDYWGPSVSGERKVIGANGLGSGGDNGEGHIGGRKSRKDGTGFRPALSSED